MLGIEDQRALHHLFMQRLRRVAVEHVQEMGGDRNNFV